MFNSQSDDDSLIVEDFDKVTVEPFQNDLSETDEEFPYERYEDEGFILTMKNFQIKKLNLAYLIKFYFYKKNKKNNSYRQF